ncbi:glycosyltransferase family A protein [Photobacterium rosenbergii]|uniref:Glycosyltransferase family A protein n=1 Tax=Photobacterium rosenbergii TaxID=294936 RepID=A0ABU3ZQ30_9GAMM|nr:glycosyltransferase family A protein [Photobacterium rosenbergii]MDV5172118.1 glycosyltransferase family A protein [Photobacterium rosenbergii]
MNDVSYSIVTPTYNRAHLLTRLYESICAQKYINIEWIIVDDGSQDNTKEVIDAIMSNHTGFPIKYFYKDNGGKHTALNTGFSKSTNEMLLILDSDDELTANTLSRVSELWFDLKDNASIAGIIGLCRDAETNDLIGTKFPKENMFSTITKNMFYFNRRGDTCDFIRTEYIKEYRFPELEGQRFIPESIVTYDLDKQYQYLCVNEVFEVKEYQKEGITKNFTRLAINNANGYFLRFEHLMHNCFLNQMSTKGKITVSANYYRYLWHSENAFSLKKLLDNKINPFLILSGVVIGSVYYLKDKMTVK